MVQDGEEDSDGYDTATEENEGDGIKMYLQKNGRCFGIDKRTDGAIKFRPRPKLAGVHGNGLYLRLGVDIYHKKRSSSWQEQSVLQYTSSWMALIVVHKSPKHHVIFDICGVRSSNHSFL